MANGAIIRARDEGEQRWFLGGGIHTWKIRAEETNGGFFMFEDELAEGKVTPLHRHPEVAETLYMIEGSILAHIDGVQREVGPGGVAMFPKGTAHAFRVTSKTARMLCLHTPGTGEAFYRAASEPNTTSSGRIDFARLAELAQQTGALEILGPPPFSQ